MKTLLDAAPMRTKLPTEDTLTTWRQYIYVDDQLTTTSKMGVRVATLRKWIDNMEAHWIGHGTVERVSLDELLVVAQSGARLRVVNR
jgi:hypothetical protein